LNAAEAGVHKASDLQSPVQRVVQREQRELRRRQLSNLRRSRNVAGRQRENWARSPVPVKVDKGKFRRRGATEHLSLLTRLNTGNPAEVRRPDFVNTLRRRLLAGRLRVNLVAQARDNRALMVSRLRHNSTSSSSEAARLPQSITARVKDSRKVERRDNQKKRHRQGRNNFGALTPAAPERETPEPLLILDTSARGVAAFVSNAGRSPRPASLKRLK
jgi:hypothetical protein